MECARFAGIGRRCEYRAAGGAGAGAAVVRGGAERGARVRGVGWRLESAVADCHLMQLGMWRWLVWHGAGLWRAGIGGAGAALGGPRGEVAKS